jgi:negative regulator of sigma-B (phosphoserine phosphatase)
VSDWPARLEAGVAGRPISGELRSGDRAVLAAVPPGALVAAIDGLGHGEEAADAAQTAAGVLEARPGEDLAGLIGRCHAALRRSRGVVLTVAWFDLERGTLSWTGVGNVEGRLVRAATGPTEGAFVRGGVVGHSLPAVRTTATALADGDLVVLATDGIDSGFAPALEAGGSAQALAARVLARHARAADDALAVVVRYHAAIGTRPATTLEGR